MTLQGHWIRFVFITVFCLITLSLFMAYICNNGICNSNSPRTSRSDKHELDKLAKRHRIRYGFNIEKSIRTYNFSFSGEDVMVFLHIQKTGGTTFGKHLVRNLRLKNPCECKKKKTTKFRCDCYRPNSKKIWLFSRYSLGWPCGLHADYTELSECVPGYLTKRDGANKNRRFLYVTILREPISRFISEFLCYHRGTTWAGSLHKCNGRTPTKQELPPCYSGDTWIDVTISEFLNCTSNLAFNRQTRMLADLKVVNCYNRTTGPSPRKRGKLLLRSAMQKLRNMAYFGLTEYQQESQYLFEKTFGIKFRKSFRQKQPEETRSGDALEDFTKSELKRIRSLNSLDIRLYEFAKVLFFYRVRYFQEQDKRAKLNLRVRH